jgi:hypothetical protein
MKVLSGPLGQTLRLRSFARSCCFALWGVYQSQKKRCKWVVVVALWFSSAAPGLTASRTLPAFFGRPLQLKHHRREATQLMNATCLRGDGCPVSARPLFLSLLDGASTQIGISLVILAATLLPVAGCGGGGSSTPESAPSPSPPSMGASGPETCNNSGHILPAGDVNTDLQISGGTGCIIDGRVPGGNYVYRNVNIWGGGSLTFNDAKINFHAHSILVENQGTLQAGLAAPVAGPISIWLYGSKDDGIPSITCQSSPTCGVSPAIWNSNPLVANNVSMGTMTMPTEPCIKASTIDPTTPVGTDCFYQYEVFDRGDAAGAFFGKKVLAVSYGGILFLRGQKGIREVTANGPAIDATPSDSGTSWVRLNQTIATANLGTTSLYVDRAVPTWQAGDQIVVTSTDYLPAHSEELTIASISSDTNGTKITVNPPGVQYPHWGEAYDFSSFPATTGPRDDQNRPETQASRHLENRAAVALQHLDPVRRPEPGLAGSQHYRPEQRPPLPALRRLLRRPHTGAGRFR